MLKKLLTGCLTIAMAAALTLPVMAADVTVGGRARASLLQTSVTPADGDATSAMDMNAEGRIHAVAKAEEGDWAFSGKVELRSNNSHDAYVSPVVLQKYWTLENDAMAFSLGTKWFGFAYFTPFMGTGGNVDRSCYGCLNLRDDRLMVDLKDVGLTILYGVNSGRGITDSAGPGLTLTVTGLDNTEIGLMYTGQFDALKVGFQYLSDTLAIDDDDTYAITDSTGTVVTSGLAKDVVGSSVAATQMDILVQYAISEGMFVEFDYETTSVAPGEGDPNNLTMMGLAFSMALSEAMGFTFAYDMGTDDSSTSDAADDVATTLMTLYLTNNMGGGTVFFGYNSDTSSVDGEAGDATSKIEVGGAIFF